MKRLDARLMGPIWSFDVFEEYSFCPSDLDNPNRSKETVSKELTLIQLYELAQLNFNTENWLAS